MGNTNESFLRIVAEDLYNEYGDNLSNITVVFPNYRSRLFFNNYLAEIVDKPIWSPRYTSIQDLFIGLSDKGIADQMKLICILHSIYKQYVNQEESFDEFYFWGEILLSDFDDIDKNLVDAQILFSNIRDLGEQIDTFEHLSEEQKQYLKTFFLNFSPENSSRLKEKFIELWDALFSVYDNFKKSLQEQHLAYEGMLYREVIERLKKEGMDGFNSEKYAFVGFNVLNECEKALFKLLESSGKAIFYWDYDTYYTDNRLNEAGKFINEDKLMFPNRLPKTMFESLSTDKKSLTFVSASTENAQARYLSNHLQKAKETYKDSDIAVVLCNEGLLLPVLHSIPDCIEKTNVTMGFPLSQTPAYSLLLNLLDMQLDIRQSYGSNKYRYATVAPLLRHPYIQTTIYSSGKLSKILASERKLYPSLEEILECNRIAIENINQFVKKPITPDKLGETIQKINSNLQLILRWANTPTDLLNWILDVLKFIATYHHNIDKEKSKEEKKRKENKKANSQEEKEIEDSPLYDDLYEEALFRLYTQLNRLKEVICEEKVELSIPVLIRLIKRLLSKIIVPFKGEPVQGMQIMGFLETRNLDFKNVILLSVNEGKLPNSGNESSFIPYNIRKGYGMTTIDHKNSLYAYYFYRLLQRAEKVTMLYNTATEGMNRGQMSRFMLQLMVEKGNNIDIDMLDIHANVPIAEPHPITIEKTDKEIEILKNKYDIRLQKTESFFSPTAINSYIDCSLKFYYKYVLGLKIDNDLTDEVDSPMFGSIFHKAAELFYKEHLGKVLSKDFLEKAANDRAHLSKLVDEAFKTEYFQLDANSTKTIDYTGEQLIYRKVEIDLLNRLLKADAEYAPFSIYELEKNHYEQIAIKAGKEEVLIKVGGIVDRIDLKDGIMRTVDYKTSSEEVNAATIESIFLPSNERENYLVQVLLYATILAKENPQYTVQPTLLFVTKKMDNNAKIQIKEDDEKKGTDINNIQQMYEGNERLDEVYLSFLKNTLTDIFDKSKPFKQTEIADSCTYCDFRNICRR
ncbi:MAG: PD-(D/E)XK nuclease family protein [Paludibacteraceae bacterium]|nr:PD-(D/E)XK nuclease family protein [Paludibacteraceae bacterium]